MTRKANWKLYEPPNPELQEALTPLVALINTLQEHSRYWEIGAILHALTSGKAPRYSLTNHKGRAIHCPSKGLGEGTPFLVSLPNLSLRGAEGDAAISVGISRRFSPPRNPEDPRPVGGLHD